MIVPIFFPNWFSTFVDSIVFLKCVAHICLVVAGATLEELAETEATLKCRFPPAARLLYRLCNGQRIPENVLDDDQVEDHYVGLIGGYNFSHHFVNVHLLSLRQVIL